MNPRLEAAPLTREDFYIWWAVRRRFGIYPSAWFEEQAAEADRRDAARMFRILYRGCRFCGEPPHPSLGDVLHLRDCVYATTGARLIIWEGQR